MRVNSPTCLKSLYFHPCIHAKGVGHIKNVLEVGPTFMAVSRRCFPKIKRFVSLGEEKGRRDKFVKHVVQSPTHLMSQIGIPAELGLLRPVDHARLKAKLKVILTRLKRELVIAVSGIYVQRRTCR